MKKNRKYKFKRLFCFILVTCFVSGHKSDAFIYAQTVTSDTSCEPEVEKSVTDIEEYNTNEIIVKYIDGGLKTASKEKTQTVLAEDYGLIEVDNEKELEETIEDLSNDENVEYIQPNYVYQLYETNYSTLGISNDEYSDSQWAYKNTGYIEQYKMNSMKDIDIDLERAWSMFPVVPEKEVIVAVVDTGIDYKHPDLVNHMWTNTGEVNNNGIDDDKNGYVDDYYGWNFYDDNNITCRYDKSAYKYGSFQDDHGTHVAGIIAAEANNKIGVAGVAGNINVKIISAQALGEEGYAFGFGTTASVTKAIKYAESMGATICNLSLGGDQYDPVMEKVIKESNMLFVIAGGNGGEDGNGYDVDNCAIYPACYDSDNIISVANMSYTGSLDESSNFGKKHIDIAAPGTYILSSWVFVPSIRNYRFSTETGTSMATPMVTGVAALLSAYYDDIDHSTIKEAILGSTNKLDTLKGKVVSNGMLDAYEALKYNVDYPRIKTTQKAIKKSNNKKIIVRFTDRNNDITSTRYAKGKKQANYYEKGVKGKAVKRNKNKASLTINASGYYTFYVLDAKGNENVVTTKVTVLTVKKVKLSATKKTLSVGKSYTIKTELSPSKVYSALFFKSSNKKVATVNTKGKIVAKKRGTTVITVTTSNRKKATCKIIVK